MQGRNLLNVDFGSEDTSYRVSITCLRRGFDRQACLRPDGHRSRPVAGIIRNSEFPPQADPPRADITHNLELLLPPPSPANPCRIRAVGRQLFTTGAEAPWRPYGAKRHKGHQEIICVICGFFTSIHSHIHIILSLRKEMINNLNQFVNINKRLLSMTGVT